MWGARLSLDSRLKPLWPIVSMRKHVGSYWSNSWRNNSWDALNVNYEFLSCSKSTRKNNSIMNVSKKLSLVTIKRCRKYTAVIKLNLFQLFQMTVWQTENSRHRTALDPKRRKKLFQGNSDISRRKQANMLPHRVNVWTWQVLDGSAVQLWSGSLVPIGNILVSTFQS